MIALSACSDRTDLSGDGSSPGTASSDITSTAVATTVPESTTSTAPATTTTTTIPPTTTTTIPLVTEGAVVLIANASSVPGAAGRLTETLRSLGFQVADPTNAAGNEEALDASKVYYGRRLPPSVIRSPV